jgi:anti-sigma factor RsiW
MLKECSKINPLLSEYVGDALAPEKQWQVKEHLDSCAVCTKIVADFSATRELLQTLPERAPSADFEKNLAARLADISLSQPKLSWHERLQQFFATQKRPVFATSIAFAAIIPLILVVSTKRATVIGPTPSAVVATAESETTLTEILDEHDAHQTAQSLEDSSVALDGTLLAKAD